MPSWSSVRRSSRPEHNMPSDETPFILRRVISKSPGSTVPTWASATRSPTEKFQAPQTTWTGSGPRASTSTRRILSAFGMASMARTRATTTPSSPSPTGSTPSTTRPSSLRASASSPTGAAIGAKSRSQDRGTLMTAPSELGEEPDVVVEQDPHVGELVTDLGAAVDAEAEGEARPFLGVDAHGGED